MKLISAVQCAAVAGFVSFLVACSSESVIVDPSVSANSSSEIIAPSSSSEVVYSSSSEQEPFNPSDYRTCDEKYEGKFLMRQYKETLDAWYGTWIINTDFYKCENGKWSGPFATSPEDLMEGDVIRVAPDDWKCNAENEGVVQSWVYTVYAVAHSPMGFTPVYYARCEQGDWILCDEPTSSASALGSSSSSDENESSSSSELFLPKEAYLNPDVNYGTMTDDRDGKVYRTVEIGDQVWMAENLNYSDSVKTPSLKGHSLCYRSNAEYCDVAGRLYFWAAAIDSVKLANDADNPLDCGYGKICTLPDTVYGICPPGWHLPSNVDWETLLTAVGGQSTAGKLLKSQVGWNDDGNGTDAFGFSALPAAGWFSNGFQYDGNYTSFWSASENGTSSAYCLDLLYDRENASPVTSSKAFGHSVRCVKD